MAKARDIPDLDCDTPFGEAAVRAVQVRADELFTFADGVLDTSDIERVHDMRVATRRLRAALEIFAPSFEKERFKPALRQVKALADALGARRDPDVQLAALEGYAQELPGADLSGVIAELEARQAAGNEQLEAALKGLESLRTRLIDLTEGVHA